MNTWWHWIEPMYNDTQTAITLFNCHIPNVTRGEPTTKYSCSWGICHAIHDFPEVVKNWVFSIVNHSVKTLYEVSLFLFSLFLLLVSTYYISSTNKLAGINHHLDGHECYVGDCGYYDG